MTNDKPRIFLNFAGGELSAIFVARDTFGNLDKRGWHALQSAKGVADIEWCCILK